MKRLGIVIPAYNTGENIGKLLRQIADQMTDELEVIVVEDGSKDNTLEVARRFEDEGITVIHQQNQGVGPARNRGIDECSAEYIWFVDADDSIAADAVATLLSAIREYPSDCYLFGIEKKFGKTTQQITNPTNQMYSAREFAENFDSVFSSNLLNPLWNKLLKTQIIKDNDLRFKNLRSGEDAEFGVRYLSYIQSIYLMTNVLYSYVLMSSSSSSHKFQKTYFDDHAAMFKALNFYCAKTGASADMVKARWRYEATMGFYKNVFNGLPEKKYGLFRKQVKSNWKALQSVLALIPSTKKVTGMRRIICSPRLLSYMYILLKVKIAKSN